MKIFFDILVGLAFFATGVVIFVWDMSGLQQARQSLDWPTAVGQVTSSGLEFGHDDVHASVSYTYTASEKRFYSRQISFGIFGNQAGQGMDSTILKRYPKDKAVTVYYDPKQPATSVLEPGLFAPFLMPLVFGEFFCLVGISILWHAFRRVIRGPILPGTDTQKGNCIKVALAMSLLLYQLLIVVSFQPDVQAKQLQAFGERPFGISNQVFVLILQTLLYLPVACFIFHWANLRVQPAVERSHVGWIPLFGLLFNRYDDARSRWSQKVCLGVCVYTVVVLLTWMTYAAILGI